MASAAIDIRKIDDLPSICAKSGVPTDTRRAQEFADIPGWTLLLIFWGIIPFLIAAGFARNKIEVDLPLSAQTRHRIHMVDLISVAGLVVSVGLVTAALLGENTVWVWLSLVVVLLTLIGGSIVRQMVWVSGRLDRGAVVLHGVHPEFAAAVADRAPVGARSARSEIRWMPILLGVAIVVLILLFLFVRS